MNLKKRIHGIMKKLPLGSKCLWALRRLRAIGLRSRILWYYRATDDEEIKAVLAYIRARPKERLPMEASPPYNYKMKYLNEKDSIDVNYEQGYPYVTLQENKVFFPNDMSTDDVRHAVTIALIEQDENSPHKYLTKEFDINDGDTIVIIGASNGIFCLSLIDRVKKAYLFEADARWIAPLNLTLSPWRDKVEIINSFVGDRNAGQMISLDAFFTGKGERINYIQADVEGAEKKLLSGAKNTLLNNDLKTSLCCYHQQNAKTDLTAMLQFLGYQVEYSKGYFLISYTKPYIRKGVIYASKT